MTPDSFWYVKVIEGTGFRVDTPTALRLRNEWCCGDRILHFVDCSGGQCSIVASQLLGMWESTPEIRAADRDLSELIDSEGGAFS